MIFLSAGHNSKSRTIKADPGAVNKDGIKEGDLTIEFRDLVSKVLNMMKVPHKLDLDEENLKMFTDRIKTGSGSVVTEYHMDSSTDPAASGTTSIIENEADRLDLFLGNRLVQSTSNLFGIRNRGVIKESQSHRGRLGLMREDGIICLHELCFISNPDDLRKYHAHKYTLARIHAEILRDFELLIS